MEFKVGQLVKVVKIDSYDGKIGKLTEIYGNWGFVEFKREHERGSYPLEWLEYVGESNDVKHENNAVNHPSHYTNCSLECIDVMRLMFGSVAVYQWCYMTALKYLWRYKNKNGIEDLDKADFYLNYAKDMEKEIDFDEVTKINWMEVKNLSYKERNKLNGES